MEYSYSFDKQLQQDWQWTERSLRSQKLRYAQHVADRFQLRDHILFKTVVASADYQDTENEWRIEPARVMKCSPKPALWRPAVCHPPIDPRLMASMYSRGSNITPDSGHITQSTLAASE